ncbi:MAG: SprT family zinc-dependent metalloprotease [Gallionella sp.]|nr:SprT family zinc-dependent metalloprotease [Gallionella sp.]
MLKKLRNLVLPSGVSPLRRNDPSAEQRAAVLAGQHITYTLKRSARRRSIGLRVDDRGLTVSMPLRASERWLHSVLQDKASWVLEKLAGWQMRKAQVLSMGDGEFIPYLGEQLTLRVQRSVFAAPACQHGDTLWVSVQDEGDAKKIEQRVSEWYRLQAGQLFAARVAHYAGLLQVVPRAIKLSSAKTQWGSCNARGTVRLNLQLVKFPLRLIDYVVVHELAHLREMNHSADFWKVVAGACPDYAKLRRELKAVSLG